MCLRQSWFFWINYVDDIPPDHPQSQIIQHHLPWSAPASSAVDLSKHCDVLQHISSHYITKAHCLSHYTVVYIVLLLLTFFRQSLGDSGCLRYLQCSSQKPHLFCIQALLCLFKIQKPLPYSRTGLIQHSSILLTHSKQLTFLILKCRFFLA